MLLESVQSFELNLDYTLFLPFCFLKWGRGNGLQVNLINRMKNFHIAGKISPDHYTALQLIQDATGQTQSEVLREAIALYLKKSEAVTVRSRLDALEKKEGKLAAMIIHRSYALYRSTQVCVNEIAWFEGLQEPSSTWIFCSKLPFDLRINVFHNTKHRGCTF